MKLATVVRHQWRVELEFWPRCAGVQARSAACARLLVFNSVAAFFLRFFEMWEVWCAIALGVRVPLCLGVALARLRSAL